LTETRVKRDGNLSSLPSSSFPPILSFAAFSLSRPRTASVVSFPPLFPPSSLAAGKRKDPSGGCTSWSEDASFSEPPFFQRSRENWGRSHVLLLPDQLITGQKKNQDFFLCSPLFFPLPPPTFPPPQSRISYIKEGRASFFPCLSSFIPLHGRREGIFLLSSLFPFSEKRVGFPPFSVSELKRDVGGGFLHQLANGSSDFFLYFSSFQKQGKKGSTLFSAPPGDVLGNPFSFLPFLSSLFVISEAFGGVEKASSRTASHFLFSSRFPFFFFLWEDD